MSILNRFSDIVNSNVNSMLDQAEDPRKMVSFITREIEQTLVAIRTESTRFLAARKRLVHKRDQLLAESDQWQQRAELAIEKARDDLAKAALKEKHFYREAINHCEVEIRHIDGVVAKLSSDANQLTEKLKFAKARQKVLVLRGRSVKSRMKVRRQLHDTSCDDALNRFEAFERKIDDLEGEAESWELGARVHNGSSDASLEGQLEALAADDKLDSELKKLKQRIQSKG
jgi:phage shock protein A|tara:strand:- start:5006 stop:5692 length:687 start_codon:yes stop_codon:yes gene_type:complete